MRTIYLDLDEEIISVINQLSQVETEQVNLVVPRAAQIWQSSINLKLLKREADNLGKKVTLIIPDDLGSEMAEKIGFLVKKEKDFPIELVQEEEEVQEQESAEEVGFAAKKEKDFPAELARQEDVQENETAEENLEENSKIERDKKDIFGFLVDELKPEIRLTNKKFLRLPSLRFKEPTKRMVDIINPDEDVELRSFRRQAPKEKPTVKARRILEPIRKKQILKERLPQEMRRSSRSSWSKFFIIFIGLAFLMTALVGYLILPTTEVIISPKREVISFDLSIVGSGDISQVDESLNKIPLQEVEIERTRSREFSASGEKELNEKARGTVTIYNEYSSSPQTLVATTRFESPEGKIFRITKNIIVPGAKIAEAKIVPSSIDVELVADQAGEAYNIGPTNFTIPGFKGTAKYVGFYGKSEVPMSGGLIGKVKIVSADDLEKAEASLTEELKNEVKQALQGQIPTDLKLIEEGLKEEVAKISSNIKEGAQADKFTLEMKVTLQAFLFKEEDLKSLVNLNLISRIPENKYPLSESQRIDWGEPVIDWTKREVFFQLVVQEDIAWQIDTQSLKKDLAGQGEIEVRKYLANRPEVEKAKVTFWPFWVKRIPFQEKKIKIIIEESY